MLIATGMAIIIVVTLATGYFVALEFAYVAVDRTRLMEIAESDGPKAAKARRALKICSRLSFTLSGAQLGITVTTLFVGFFAEPYLGQGLAALFGTTGIPTAVSLAVAVGFAFIIANVIQMIIGELGPKNLAIARAEQVALALARPTQWYLMLAGPLIWFFDTTSTKLLRIIGVSPVEELDKHATPEDLHHIIDTSRDVGSLDARLSALLDRGLDFTDIVAEQAMTPRVAVQTLDSTASVSEAVRGLQQGRSRFPVIGEDVDDIVGVVGISQVLTVPRDQRGTVPVSDIARETLLIPGSLPLPTLLEKMRHEHRQLACVVDEYGGFAGIVTLEDIVEELVGEIRDEQDRFEAVPVSLAGGAWLIPGRWRIDEIEDATGARLPEGEHYETVSGLVMQELGRVVRPGDRVYVDTVPDRDGPPVTMQLVVVSTSRHVPQAVEMRPVQLSRKGGGVT